MEKKIVVLAGFFALLVLALVFLFFPPGEAENAAFPENFSAEGTGENFPEENENSLVLQRSSYGVSPSVFSLLPTPPRDFNSVVSLYHAGKFRDEHFFSEKYFLQPEFYPSFLESGLTYWTNPSTSHYAAYGYGSYKVKKTVFIGAGETAAARFFFHSGYGVRSFQGVRLVAEPENPGDGGFFDVQISPESFLLEPNFPRFGEKWARAIEISVRAPEGIPEGSYRFFVRAVSPEKEFGDSWRETVPGKYFDAGFANVETPIFEFEIIVE